MQAYSQHRGPGSYSLINSLVHKQGLGEGEGEGVAVSLGQEGVGAAHSPAVGFGHNAVLGAAPQVIDAVNTGKLKHIFLVGG